MRTDLLYALTPDNISLPVIDVTNPSFKLQVNDATMIEMSERYVAEAAQRREVPSALREALQHSLLGRGLMAAQGTFLTGMSTYLLKLGPENMGSDATTIDRKIASSFPALTARIRLQDVSSLMADGLSQILKNKPNRSIGIINVGGGPAPDSWNALILLHAGDSEILVGRKIVIAVLDLDDYAPAFGANVISRLRATGAPLSGLNIEFRAFKYDWSEAKRIREHFDIACSADMACAISSEGALFEYGSDQEIISNLEIFHACTSADSICVGSVTRKGKEVSVSQIASGVSTRPRSIETFRGLAERAGWVVQRVIERPFSYNLCLVKA